MRSAIIIPARYQSSRLPGKPLLRDSGKYLIQHSVENAMRSKADHVVVATDDKRIFDAVESFGGKAVMTSSDHETGSGRIAEAAEQIDAEIILNVQGDEPEIDPCVLDGLIDLHEKAMRASRPAFVSTLVSPFAENAKEGHGSPQDPSCVKAVLAAPDADGLRSALYFTRSLAPYPRDEEGRVDRPQDYFLHIGLYAFSKASLAAFAVAPSGRLEAMEKLEQLRILEMGERIVAAVIEGAVPGIDTPEDYQAFLKRLRD
jgi:3-deoxy-manno-octulosonate cytidylyltransferase (CMP-KDO synthetase)